jgi:hypothetical protein
MTTTRGKTEKDERWLRIEEMVEPDLGGNPDLVLVGVHMVYVGPNEGPGDKGAPPPNTFG